MDRSHLRLSEAQRVALEAYDAFQHAHAEFFRPRKLRSIVDDRDRLEAYASKTGTILGVLVDNPYVVVLNDLVVQRDPAGIRRQYPYLRILSKATLAGGEGVVVVAQIRNSSLGKPGDLVLVEQERHSTGSLELEFPRGFGEPGASAVEQGLEELRQETGFLGSNPEELGRSLQDTGLTNSEASFVGLDVIGRENAAPEAREALSQVVVMPEADVWRAVHAGRVRDGFTIQGLALLAQARYRSSGGKIG